MMSVIQCNNSIQRIRKAKMKSRSLDAPITPKLSDYMNGKGIEGHVHSPAHSREDTLDWIEGRNKGVGCKLPCMQDSDLRLLPGSLCIWAGINGHGKSALIQQYCLWWSAGRHTDKQEKILFWSPEMIFKVQVERMIKQSLGVDEPTRAASNYAIDFLDGKVYIYDKEENVTVQEIVALARWASDSGYTQLVIDSLSMVNLGSRRKDDVNLHEQSFVRSLKEAARSTGLHIHLVVHMRKGENEYRSTDKMDIKGAGEITDLADYVFIIDRHVKKEIELNKPGNENNEDWLDQPDGSVRCIKNRYDPIHRQLPLWFCGKMFSFKKGRRADIPRLIEPSMDDLKRGYAAQ